MYYPNDVVRMIIRVGHMAHTSGSCVNWCKFRMYDVA
jgi:hypothetical protein